MPTLFQLKSWVEQEIRKGKGEFHTNHVVIIEEEAAEKALNPPTKKASARHESLGRLATLTLTPHGTLRGNDGWSLRTRIQP